MSEETNLLVILSDQLQRDMLGCYGGPVPTPHLDRLAARGTVFERAYCATPLCVPTRPSIQTGRWPHEHGAISFGADYCRVRPGTPLLVDRLAEAGYDLGYEGVWHVNRAVGETGPAEERAAWRPDAFPYQAFAERYVAQGGEPGSQTAQVRTRSDRGVEDWSFSLPLPAEWREPAEEHPDRVRARRTAAAIEAADGPFAWWCSLTSPHPPLLVPSEYLARFSPDDVDPPPSFGQDLSELPEAVRNAPGAQAVAGWPWERWAPCAAAYRAFVAFVDDCVGVMLDALDASGHADDTLVLFLADHGECLGAHSLYQKGVAYEESSAIPLLVAGPGVSAGWRHEPVSHVDLAPTLTERLGLEPLPEVSGRSLAGALRGGPADRDHVVVEFNGYINGGPGWRMVAEERWKYVCYDDGEQLFDRATDPAELTNLAEQPAHRARLQAMRAKLAQWRARTSDRGPRPGEG